MSEDPHKLVSVRPGEKVPEWPLSWVNVWIDHEGGQHWSRYTHGSVFEAAFERAYGRPVGADENAWMMDKVGSVGDAEDDEDDNPGWQFNELADRSLGWVRVKAYGMDGEKPNWTLKFGDEATHAALQAAIRLVSAQPKDAVFEIEQGDMFGAEAPRGKALKELREWAAEAPDAPDLDDEDEAEPEASPAP